MHVVSSVDIAARGVLEYLKHEFRDGQVEYWQCYQRTLNLLSHELRRS
jgi:hypothetical protein